MYPDTKLISPDLYVIHAGSHAHAYTHTCIHPECRVLKRHCNDCIEALPYFLTQVISLSPILSLRPPRFSPYTGILSHISTMPTRTPLPSDEREREREREREVEKIQLPHT